jgi:hypothetical protein
VLSLPASWLEQNTLRTAHLLLQPDIVCFTLALHLASVTIRA